MSGQLRSNFGQIFHESAIDRDQYAELAATAKIHAGPSPR